MYIYISDSLITHVRYGNVVTFEHVCAHSESNRVFSHVGEKKFISTCKLRTLSHIQRYKMILHSRTNNKETRSRNITGDAPFGWNTQREWLDCRETIQRESKRNDIPCTAVVYRKGRTRSLSARMVSEDARTVWTSFSHWEKSPGWAITRSHHAVVCPHTNTRSLGQRTLQGYTRARTSTCR